MHARGILRWFPSSAILHVITSIMRNLARFFSFAVVLLPTEAHAYIDSTAGGTLLQLLLAGAAGALLVIKLYFRKWISFWKRTPHG